MDAQSYFQSHQEYFWEWSTDSDSDEAYNLLQVPHVGTIGYRPYVLELLRQLADEGLPPFGAFLLVLYASGNTHATFDGLQYHLRRIKRQYGTLADTDAVLNLLQNIRELKSTYKTPQHKMALLYALFRDCHHRISPGDSRKILVGIADADTLKRCAQPALFKTDIFIRDLHTLALIAQKFPTVQSLLEAVQEQPPKPEIPEEIISQTAPQKDVDLITALLQNPETFPVAALIKRLWSGLRVQMHPSSPGLQPLGGVSDVTNKGPLDRLLLSEFANPDELLLLRLANSEALYVQREIPPEENRRERVLLTDVSLQGWGTPKVLNHAAALAIATHPKSQIPTRIFTLGEEAQEMFFHNAEAVFEGVQHVSAALDAHEGLAHFFASQTTAKEREVFLFLSEATWAEEALQQALRVHRDQLSFLVLTRPDGTLQLFDMRRGGKKLVQTLTLPLEELWKAPVRPRKSKSADVAPEEYPILLPISISNKLAILPLDDDFYFLSTRKHLYQIKAVSTENYYNPSLKALKPLHRNVSFKAAGVFALGYDADGLQLCQLRPADSQLSVLHLSTKAYTRMDFPASAGADYKLLFVEGQFYVVEANSKYCYQIDFQNKLWRHVGTKREDLRKALDKIARAESFYFGPYTYKVLSSHNTIGINERGELQLSHYSLQWEGQNVRLQKAYTGRFKAVAKREGKTFYFEDGSAVHTNSEGMIRLRSSDASLPDIFIPTALDFTLTIATDTFYTGSPQFVPHKSSLKTETIHRFYQKFFEPFLDRILRYES